MNTSSTASHSPPSSSSSSSGSPYYSTSLSPGSQHQHHHSPLRQTSKKNTNREYTVKVNFIEIYKEELKDLLDPTAKDIQIREDENGNTSKQNTFKQFNKLFINF
jgi:hypothetical protein